jgi:transposase
VLSLDDRAAAHKQRAKQLARAEAEVATLNRGVPRYTNDAATLERKARAKLERRGVEPLLRLQIVEEEGRPQARLARDEQQIAEAMRLDGRYCLASNGHTLTADGLFCAYKRQHLIESRLTDLKGPIQVRPVFLHSNRRIVALLAVISLALLLYGLIERQVRRGLSSLATHERKLLDKRVGRATGRKILDQLSDLAAVRIRDGPTRLAQPRPVQQLLLQLLENQRHPSQDAQTPTPDAGMCGKSG